jgi:branched-chain amino acid transport system substrate-binding protein
MTYLASSMPARSIERTCLAMKQLKATPINDMFARNGHIRADGRMVHDLYLVQVKAPDQIKEKWDYYTIKETVPGDEAFQPLSESRCRLVTR